MIDKKREEVLISLMYGRYFLFEILIFGYLEYWVIGFFGFFRCRLNN